MHLIGAREASRRERSKRLQTSAHDRAFGRRAASLGRGERELRRVDLEQRARFSTASPGAT
ncbi:MAG: hypothetical protein H6723_09035 [Sandaracinus sp.]|nr:hypothetical protein [Sandaracinus sp.]